MFDIFKPLEIFTNFVIYGLFKLTPASKFGESLNFFLYDVIKIFILILIISFFAGLIKSYFDAEKSKLFLSGKHSGVGNILGAMLGIVTPFCSCSAVPLFMGFLEAGIPLGITFSFLIAAPMINEIAIVLLWSLFGIKITVVYIFSGLIIAIFGGILIGILRLERYVEPFIHEFEEASSCCSKTPILRERIENAGHSAFKILRTTWFYIVIGVGIGALMHGYVPTDFLLKYAGANNPFAVPTAVLLGIPLYGGCAGILPIALVLAKMGLPIGTVLAFTMAVTAISLPELLILKRVIKMPLLSLFVAILTVAIIFTGYLFNFIL